ncbi:MAG: diacylglycerol/lipid kinase family protein [Burkholderiales bacterium]
MSGFLVVFNPAAGRGRARRLWPQIAQALRAAELGFDFVQTRAPLDAVRLAEGAAGRYDAVIAAGGDGTVHEALNGLMRVPPGTRPALGVLPLGSGDDYAKMLPPLSPGAPRPQWRAALGAIARGESRAHDVGLMRGVHVGEPVLRVLRARRVVIESEAPLVIEADGELPPLRTRRIEIEVVPRALRVLA